MQETPRGGRHQSPANGGGQHSVSLVSSCRREQDQAATLTYQQLTPVPPGPTRQPHNLTLVDQTLQWQPCLFPCSQTVGCGFSDLEPFYAIMFICVWHYKQVPPAAGWLLAPPPSIDSNLNWLAGAAVEWRSLACRASLHTDSIHHHSTTDQ